METTIFSISTFAFMALALAACSSSHHIAGDAADGHGTEAEHVVTILQEDG